MGQRNGNWKGDDDNGDNMGKGRGTGRGEDMQCDGELRPQRREKGKGM